MRTICMEGATFWSFFSFCFFLHFFLLAIIFYSVNTLLMSFPGLYFWCLFKMKQVVSIRCKVAKYVCDVRRYKLTQIRERSWTEKLVSLVVHCLCAIKREKKCLFVCVSVFVCVCGWVLVCVCGCVCEKERERESQWGRECMYISVWTISRNVLLLTKQKNRQICVS